LCGLTVRFKGEEAVKKITQKGLRASGHQKTLGDEREPHRNELSLYRHASRESWRKNTKGHHKRVNAGARRRVFRGKESTAVGKKRCGAQPQENTYNLKGQNLILK